MCGIAGAFNNRAIPDNVVSRMCSAMLHRGPDSGDVYSDKDGVCWLGHRRLSILDLSSAANQPMLSQNGRYVMVFNGEIYNFHDLRKLLIGKGYQFTSSGDTEVLLEWWSHYGAEGICSIEGMFAFAIWDKLERSLVLARDPMGIKPCYYALTKGGIVFASEIRAILSSQSVERRISFNGLRSYLAYGSVSGQQTIIENVYELPPGHYLQTSLDQPVPRFKRFWAPKYPNYNSSVLPTLAGEFDERFDATVAAHLVSDVPLGMFLSGGIDSSSVVASAVKAGHGDVRTLCVVLPSKQSQNDAYYAKLVAEHLGTSHTAVDFSTIDMCAMTKNSLAAMDQPTIDGINTFIVAKAARESGLTVALSGLGGDELFGGYPSFRQLPLYASYIKHMGKIGRQMANLAATLLVSRRPTDRIINRFQALISSNSSMEALFAAYYQHFTGSEVAWLLRLAPDNSSEVDSGNDIQDTQFQCSNYDDVDAISFLELSLHMGYTMLRDTDVMSMASSLEVRVPFLHSPFVDYVQSLGKSVRKYEDGKFNLRKMLAKRIPSKVVQRGKVGFFLPMDDILTNPLRSFAEDHIRLADQTLFCGSAHQLWYEFLTNPKREGWQRIWSIIVLISWAQTNMIELPKYSWG